MLLARLASRYIRGDSGLSPTECTAGARRACRGLRAEFMPPMSPFSRRLPDDIARIPSRMPLGREHRTRCSPFLPCSRGFVPAAAPAI